MTPRQRIDGTVIATDMNLDYPVVIIQLDPSSCVDIDSVFTWTLKEWVTVVRNEPNNSK